MTKRTPFTMIEILVVMAIILILVGMVFGVFPYVSRKAKDQKTQSNVRALEVILQQYNGEWGFYPQMSTPITLGTVFFSGLKSPDNKPYLDNSEAGMSTHPTYQYVDAHGNPFWYQCPGTRNPELFDLWSTGQDGLHGSEATSTPGDALDNDAGDRTCDDIANFKRN